MCVCVVFKAVWSTILVPGQLESSPRCVVLVTTSVFLEDHIFSFLLCSSQWFAHFRSLFPVSVDSPSLSFSMSTSPRCVIKAEMPLE